MYVGPCTRHGLLWSYTPCTCRAGLSTMYYRTEQHICAVPKAIALMHCDTLKIFMAKVYMIYCFQKTLVLLQTNSFFMLLSLSERSFHPLVIPDIESRLLEFWGRWFVLAAQAKCCPCEQHGLADWPTRRLRMSSRPLRASYRYWGPQIAPKQIDTSYVT